MGATNRYSQDGLKYMEMFDPTKTRKLMHQAGQIPAMDETYL